MSISDALILNQYAHLGSAYADPRMQRWAFHLERPVLARLADAVRSLGRLVADPSRVDLLTLRSVAVEVAVDAFLLALVALPRKASAPAGADVAQLAPGMRDRMDPRRRGRLVAVDVTLTPKALDAVDAVLTHVLAADCPTPHDAAWWLTEYRDELRDALFAEAVTHWLALRAAEPAMSAGAPAAGRSTALVGALRRLWARP